MQTIKTAGKISLILAGAVLIAAGAIRIENSINEIPLRAENLQSLPYLAWNMIEEADIGKSGVTFHDREKAFTGLNLYNAVSIPRTYLLDMQGNIVHAWVLGEKRVLLSEVKPNGDLYVLIEGQGLKKFDWSSNLLWEKPLASHHDFALRRDGGIYVWTEEKRIVNWRGRQLPIVDNHIVQLSESGEELRKISVFDHFREWLTDDAMDRVKQRVEAETTPIEQLKAEANTVYDIFHANSLEIIDRDVKGIFKKGDLLISIHRLNIIAVIDPEKEEVLWTWGKGELQRQHSPSLLKNDNILVFDNQAGPQKSRLVEVDPLTRDIVKTYDGGRENPFYTKAMGHVQRLPNGNDLITESNKGHMFEVTAEGKRVWDFWTPETRKKKKIKRAVIYRFTRLDPHTAAGLPFEPDTLKDLKEKGYFQ